MSAGIPKTGIELELLDLSEQVLRGHGFAVVDVDFHPMGRSLVRVFVERTHRPAADGSQVPATGTTLDDCAEASRILDEALEARNLISGAYDLEISSPGLDRRLRTLGDFQKSVGRTVQIRFTRKLEEFGLGAKTTAELIDVDGESLKFASSGKRYEVPWQHLKQANMVWSPEASGEKKA